MDQDQVKKIIDLRKHFIEMFNALDGKNEPTAVVKQTDVANDISFAIKKIDNILKDYVKFS
jgi:hypothetical protein